MAEIGKRDNGVPPDAKQLVLEPDPLAGFDRDPRVVHIELRITLESKLEAKAFAGRSSVEPGWPIGETLHLDQGLLSLMDIELDGGVPARVEHVKLTAWVKFDHYYLDLYYRVE